MSSDPEVISNMLDEIDSDASDDDFDGYISKEGMCVRGTEKNDEIISPRAEDSDRDGMGNNNNESGESEPTTIVMTSLYLTHPRQELPKT